MSTPEPQSSPSDGRTQAPPGARPPWLWWLVGCGGCGCLVAIAAFVVLIGALRPHKMPPPIGYVGQWIGQDGTSLEIASDGSASYRAPASNISGGGVVVDETGRSLRVTLGPFRKTWRIDDPPHQGNGVVEMVLDGVIFRRGTPDQPIVPAAPQAGGSPGLSGGAPARAEVGPTPAPSTAIPTDEEIKQLTTQTLLLFDQGLQSGDFRVLESQASAQFRQENPPGQLKLKFRQFFARRLSIAGIATAAEVFEPAPNLDVAGALVASGYYTTARRVFFTLVYVKEEGVWKLARIRVEV